LRAIRLRALADAPTAFGSTLAQEESFPERVWHERAARGAVADDLVTFIAERDGLWIGLATGLAEDPDGSGPVLAGMFVDPDERGHGVGRGLVEAVAAWARASGATCLYLSPPPTIRRLRCMVDAASSQPARPSLWGTRPPSTSNAWYASCYERARALATSLGLGDCCAALTATGQ
jgi:GNAT superfamily N-acetyltransferase